MVLPEYSIILKLQKEKLQFSNKNRPKTFSNYVFKINFVYLYCGGDSSGVGANTDIVSGH
jgi:hypothetical protein